MSEPPKRNEPASRTKSPPPLDEQQRLIDEAREASFETEGLFARAYRKVVDLSGARLATVYGVLGGSLFFYLNGIAATWITSAGASQMSLAAGVFGAAAGIVAARSMPKIRALDRSEGYAAQAQLEAAATIVRYNTFEPLLLRLPEDYKPLVLDQVFHPQLLSKEREKSVTGRDLGNAEGKRKQDTNQTTNVDRAPTGDRSALARKREEGAQKS